MPEPSEIVGYLLTLSVLCGALWIFRRGLRLEQTRVRVIICTLSGLVTGVLSVCLLFAVVVSAACSKTAPALASPDGKYLAISSYVFQGALGADYASVTVRRAFHVWGDDVYTGEGGWRYKTVGDQSPEVRWLDNTHLQIRYFDTSGKARCLARAGDIRVTCLAGLTER